MPEHDSVLPDGDSPVTIPKRVLAAVFDLATTSADYASGYMTNEDVDVLRGVARILGVDPATVTPTNFLCRYEPHEWRPVVKRMPVTSKQVTTGLDQCSRCGKERGSWKPLVKRRYDRAWAKYTAEQDRRYAAEQAERKRLGIPEPMLLASTSFIERNGSV